MASQYSILIFGLNALRNNRQTQLSAHCYDRTENPDCLFRVSGFAQQRAVDLQDRQRQMQQIRQAGVSLTEIVNSDSDATCRKFCERLVHQFGVFECFEYHTLIRYTFI